MSILEFNAPQRGNLTQDKRSGNVRAVGENEPGAEKIHADLTALQSVLEKLDAFGQIGWNAIDVYDSEKLQTRVSNRLPQGFNHDKLKEYLKILDAQSKIRAVK